ncbi:hypothetical protein DES47_101795 [Roseateles toxinivorans]|uniref:Uncharacterized protein n=1 Tax=Roseateles toxinivorans TaxID=270368 RepID=A0A4R6QUJ8_9BURK|nr:hypothetical protein DES47_101795 [Roseateles toxinivorans]
MRILVHLGAQKGMLSDSGFNNESLPEALGMRQAGSDKAAACDI